MIWLAWRQARTSLAVLFAILAVVTITAAATGGRLIDLERVAGSTFFDLLATDSISTVVYYAGTAITYALPALVGVFLGAPMVARELEAGTHRLAWNQSINRTTWLATKLGLAVVVAAVVGALGLAMTRWAAPIDDAIASGAGGTGLIGTARISPELFGARGIVPIAMAVLALLVGVTVGMLLRRALPAMALTLAVVLGLQIVAPVLLQPLLASPETYVIEIGQDNLKGLHLADSPSGTPQLDGIEVNVDAPGAWVLGNYTIDPSGEKVESLPEWFQSCLPPPGDASGPDNSSVAGCLQRLADAGYKQEVSYEPATRFWALQWREVGILLVAAVLLTGICFWRIHRDL